MTKLQQHRQRLEKEILLIWKAIIAVRKMLLTSIWNILSKLVPYTVVGFLSTPRVVPVSKPLTVAQGISLLRRRSYVFIDDPTTIVFFIQFNRLRLKMQIIFDILIRAMDGLRIKVSTSNYQRLCFRISAG